MVSLKYIEKLSSIIKENPGKTFTQLFEIIKEENLMAKKTFSDALVSLRNDKQVIRDENKKHYINIGERTTDDLKKTPNLLRISQTSRTKIIDIISKLYAFNELNKIELDPDIKKICREFIKKMDKNFTNDYFELTMQKLYNEEIISMVNSNLKKIQVKYIEEYDEYLEDISEHLEFLHYLEKSIQDQIKIFIHTKQKLFLSNKVVESLNNRILDLIYEIFILDSEFILTVNNIEDFNIRIEISYDPNSDDFFNLSFFSNINSQLEKLKDLILKYNNYNTTDKEKIIHKAKDETYQRNEDAKEIEHYRKRFRSEVIKNLSLDKSKLVHDGSIKKAYVAEFLSFKEEVRTLKGTTSLNEVFSNAISRYNQNKKKSERVFFRILKKELNELTKKYINKDLKDLEAEENYPALLKKINFYLKKKNITKDNKINLLIQKTRILSNKYQEYDEALEMANEGLHLNPKKIDFYLLKAITQHNRGDSLESLKTLDNAFKIDSKNYRLIFQKSFILSEINETEKAIKIILEGITYNRDNPKALELLLGFKSWLYSTQKDFIKVVEIYDELIKLFPSNIEYYKKKYNILDDNLQEFDAALEVLDLIFKKFGKNDSGYYVNKSRILCDKKGKYRDALKIANEGLEYFKQELSLYINKAIILNNMGDYKQALEVLEEAEILNENNKYDIDLLGRKSFILTNNEQYEEALKVSKRLIKIEPNSVSLILSHVDILDKLDRGLEGLQILENGLKVSPNNQELVIELTNLCFGYLKVSPLRSALKIIDDALEKEPDDIGILMNKASLLYHLNKKDEALEQLEKAKSLQDPNDEMYARILVLMSIIYNERGNIEKAIEINRKVIISFPDHYPSNLQMRKLLKFLDFKNAIQFLESAIEHFPKEIKFIKDITDLYFKYRKYKKVDFYVEKALALNPKLKTRLKMLAYKTMIEIDVNQDMDIAINLMKMTEMKDFPEVVVFPYINMAINSIIKEQEYEEGLKFYEISTFLLSKFEIKNKIDLNEFLDIFKKLKAWGQSKKDQALINRIDKVTQAIKTITEN